MEEKRSKEHAQVLEVYTDGSLKRKELTLRYGGWAYIVVENATTLVHADHGGAKDTTNQKMELTAVAEALDYVSKIRKPNERIIVYSDSAYVINCYAQEWYINWINNGWLNSEKKPVANRELWERIVPYFDNFWYDFRKVEAHSGVYWNEECDAMAQNKADRLKRGIDKE